MFIFYLHFILSNIYFHHKYYVIYRTKKVLKMIHRMVTANRLHDGAVVYLAADKDWTRNVESGLVADPSAPEKLLAIAELAVQDQIIVAPYLIEVEVVANSIHPIRFREQIRAKGPSIFAPTAE